MKRTGSALRAQNAQDPGLESDFEVLAYRSVKRIRTSEATAISDTGLATPITSSSEDIQASSEAESPAPSKLRKAYREISDKELQAARRASLRPTLIPPAFPQSAYTRWDSSCQELREVTEERDALKRLLAVFDQHQGQEGSGRPDFVAFQLDQFAIYRPEDTMSGRKGKELVTLSRLRQDGYSIFCFEGVVSFEDQQYYIKDVPFRILGIDGYGDRDIVSLEDQIYLQSSLAERTGTDIWLRLKTPAPNYERFYRPFVWLARFAKYFAEYLMEHEKVTLAHFRRKFAIWIQSVYSVRSWLAEVKNHDFRNRVTTEILFLYNECWNIDLKLCRHPIWAECNFQDLRAIPAQPNLVKRTAVTQFVNSCFEEMYFGDQLEVHSVDPKVGAVIDRRKADLGLAPRKALSAPPPQAPTSIPVEADIVQVNAGDVVLVREDPLSKWGSGPWYAYVQNVRLEGRETVLDIIWLYTAQNTTMARAAYYFTDELFFSDHCECGKDALDLDCVIDVVKVSWFVQDPSSVKGLFVRQKFRTVHQDDTYDFVSLQDSDFQCHCGYEISDFEHCIGNYSIGDPVLVRQSNLDSDSEDNCLEPAIVIAFNHIDQDVTLRRLRLKQDTASNEVVLTQETYRKRPEMIIRKCHIRSFDTADIIPTPYDRDGAGDFFITYRGHGAGHLHLPFTKGMDPSQKLRKLKGLGIFCGGGTFDRGLEEGGAVEFHYAADWATHALHSYRANLEEPQNTNFFLGSVNDLLARAMQGDRDIPSPGDIDVISAGSPCPGFSPMQANKYSDSAKQMASMVASVVAFVDFYVPKYLILENVVTMTAPMGPNKDQYVFSQIVAALVAMGYQVSQLLMDAWSYGSSQQRSRIFIIASAPGLEPFVQPPRTHGHPEHHFFQERSLGISANGLKFARRRDDYTVFKCTTAIDASKDLPNIGDSQVQTCIPFPDHRTATDEPAANRTRIALIPKRPYGMTLYQAYNTGALRGEPLEWFQSFRGNTIRNSKSSKTYGRTWPNRLFPTILTSFTIADGKNGRALHWNQDRVLTIQEARRAQGYPDHEVLVGNASQRLKIVGNSVDRKVALVLGLALRESWEKSQTNRAAESRSSPKSVSSSDDGYSAPSAHSVRSGSVSGDTDTEAHSHPADVPGFAGIEDSIAQVDNRTVKMSLILNEEEVESIRKGGFKQIIKMLQERNEHRLSLQ